MLIYAVFSAFRLGLWDVYLDFLFGEFSQRVFRLNLHLFVYNSAGILQYFLIIWVGKVLFGHALEVYLDIFVLLMVRLRKYLAILADEEVVDGQGAFSGLAL